MGILFDTPEERRTMQQSLRVKEMEVEVRKWAMQMALALTEDERNRMGGVIDAAKALETYALGPLASEGR